MTDAEVIEALITKLGGHRGGRVNVASELGITPQAVSAYISRDRIGVGMRFRVWELAQRYAITLPVDWIGREAA